MPPLGLPATIPVGKPKGITLSRDDDTFDPLTSISWTSAYWANDPDRSNPGDGNDITSMVDAGTAGVNLVPDTGRSIVFDEQYPALNNATAWVFNGTSSRTAMTSGSPTISQPNTIAVVGWLDSTHGANPTIIDGDSQRRLVRNYGTGGNVQMFAGSSRSFAGGADGGFILLATFDGASSTCRMNGSDLTVGGTVGTHTLTAFRVGADTTGSGYYKGALSFVGITEGAFTAGDITGFESWASSYYGISIA